MKKRLTKIITKTGDKGETGLVGGVRVKKDNPRIEAIGTIDELNSAIGLLIAENATINGDLKTILIDIQHQLFSLGAELSMPGQLIITEADVKKIEDNAIRLNKALPECEEFILPGGTPSAALCHLARTVCRRAERRLVALSEKETLNVDTLAYLNRLSDLLFIIARTLNSNESMKEIFWKK